jgi:two-component system sensor histidine kinase CpxA
VEEKNRKRVMEVMEDVDHLSKLVGELLAFSRADMKSNTVELESIDLLSVVQTAVKREITPLAKIITEIDPEIRVMASSELLTRALANLIRNAVKYAGTAGLIVVSALKRKDVVEIAVQDKGAGVPEDLLDQLFEPFFRPNLPGIGIPEVSALDWPLLKPALKRATERSRPPIANRVGLRLQSF